MSEKALLKLAAALERQSEHPLAEAIMAECETRGIVARMVEDFTAVPGRGVTAREGQNAIAAGNVQLMNELGITVPRGSPSNLPPRARHRCSLPRTESLPASSPWPMRLRRRAPEPSPRCARSASTCACSPAITA